MKKEKKKERKKRKRKTAMDQKEYISFIERA